MNKISLSVHATKFLEWIKTETSKPINIEISDDIGASMAAAYTTSPDEIKIKLSRQCLLNERLIDHSVCHEAVHGLLEHKQGYYYPHVIESLTIEERNLCSLVMTMINDIVVNKILADNGFSPFSTAYIRQVRREIKAINDNNDIYKEHLKIGTTFYNKFKIFRYIMAWGFLKFYKLNEEEGEIISRYIKHFKRYLHEYVDEVTEITRLIEKNDIFTAEGNRFVIEELIRKWGLSKKICLKSFYINNLV
jgi:hypothetical protein